VFAGCPAKENQTMVFPSRPTIFLEEIKLMPLRCL
jgi:hypothetical protein